MCKFIYIQDLAANALIELIEEKGCKKVSFEQLFDYGSIVVEVLREQEKEAVLLISRKDKIDMIRNYSDIFEIYEDKYIKLRNNKTIDDLRDQFRAYLSLDMLLAFIDKKSTNVLFRAA